MLQHVVKLPLVTGTCVLAFSSSVQAARMADHVYSPDPIQVPCKLLVEDVKRAVWTALVGRTWNPVERAPGVGEAKVVVRGKHTLVVDMTYTTESVVYRYKSSDNLNYKVVDGKPRIHKNANSWIQNIENDTRNNLITYCSLKK